jgi:GH25 family lysozyme M1 (1,4-beta-N-acetylmuramidase)
MNIDEVQIVYDYWEGNLVVDLATIRANMVMAFLLRLNDMRGGHHKDEKFDLYWAAVKGYLRAPYFVYNPWVDGLQNYKWFIENKPGDCTTRVVLDVEVVYKGYSGSAYAMALDYCIKKFQDSGYDPAIYTGPWFLEYLSTWPANVDYHWARYPDSMRPSASTMRTFEELRAKIGVTPWNPDGGEKAPGPVKLWQVSDKWILPGTGRHAIDVNIFPGTYPELAAWFRAEPTTPPPVVPGEIVHLPTGFITELQTLVSKYK